MNKYRKGRMSGSMILMYIAHMQRVNEDLWSNKMRRNLKIQQMDTVERTGWMEEYRKCQQYKEIMIELEPRRQNEKMSNQTDRVMWFRDRSKNMISKADGGEIDSIWVQQRQRDCKTKPMKQWNGEKKNIRSQLVWSQTAQRENAKIYQKPESRPRIISNELYEILVKCTHSARIKYPT